MRNYIMEILKLVLLLSSLQLSAEGKPLPGCSQTSEIERYDPTDPGAETTCVKCPECPEGQGLFPQCGSRVPKGIKIECIQCQANVSYSNSHGIESCKACQECGLKNVIQQCTTDKNRICGTKCPKGHFLDHNHICQECYFCCGSVSEAQRRQGCKDIGMSRDWQCEKTEQNQRCKESTTLPTRTKPTTHTAPHDHNTMTKKQSRSQVHEAHLPTKTLSGSKHSQGGSIPITSQGTRKLKMVPGDDAPRRAILENGQEEHGSPLSVGAVMGIVGSSIIITIISVFALIAFKTRIRIYFRCSGTNTSDTADNELTPLSQCEPTDSGRTSQDKEEEQEEEEEGGGGGGGGEEEQEKEEEEEPNAENIPADCRVSEMEHLHNNKGEPMLFYVQWKLDVVGTRSRKTWRCVGRTMKVSSNDLDLIETDYKAERSPTESILAKFKTFTPEPTMREFVKALVICKRNDVASYICNWPWEEHFKSEESENP